MNPAFLGIATASIWGAHDLIAGITSRKIGFLPTVLGSTLFGLIALTAWLGLRGTFPDPLQEQVWVAYACGCGYALATMCLFAALGAGPMSLGVPIAGSYPVTSLLLATAFGIVPTMVQVILALTVLFGVVIVSSTDGEAGNGRQFAPGYFWRTVAYALCAHVMFALAIWSGQLAAARFGTIETTWLSRLSGLVLLALIFGASRQTVRGTTAYIPTAALLGLLDVTAISCMNHAATTSYPEIATVIGSTFGPVTVLLAWIFLDERISPLRWFGIAVTFSGVAALSAVG